MSYTIGRELCCAHVLDMHTSTYDKLLHYEINITHIVAFLLMEHATTLYSPPSINVTPISVNPL